MHDEAELCGTAVVCVDACACHRNTITGLHSVGFSSVRSVFRSALTRKRIMTSTTTTTTMQQPTTRRTSADQIVTRTAESVGPMTARATKRALSRSCRTSTAPHRSVRRVRHDDPSISDIVGIIASGDSLKTTKTETCQPPMTMIVATSSTTTRVRRLFSARSSTRCSRSAATPGC